MGMGFGGGMTGGPQTPQAATGGQPYSNNTVEQIVASVVPSVVTQLRQRNAA